MGAGRDVFWGVLGFSEDVVDCFFVEGLAGEIGGWVSGAGLERQKKKSACD